MQLIATVISTRHLGYYVEIVSDGTLFIGAFAIVGGGADFIPGTGSRCVADTLAYVETELLGAPSSRYTVPQGPRSVEEIMELREECQRDGLCEEAV